MAINYKKITAVILIDLVILSVMYCIYGFTIGGKPEIIANVPYTIFSSITLTAVSIFTYLFITKRAIGKSVSPILLVGIWFIAYSASVGIYNLGNEFLNIEEPTEYESTVINVEQKSSGKSSHYVISFNDSNGNKVTVRDDYYAPEIGEPINVKEYSGAFGYPIFYTDFEIAESILD